ncbi:hypothetical protein [Pseudomonas sp. 8Z]|uniref:hypothetical protein n=1 Tax=Pseudomonas sp. 8Z TaxID=2653166 RepID=UPI00135C5DBE|nr:hypothetical protein [Pseudomonas sp. 8Z]
MKIYGHDYSPLRLALLAASYIVGTWIAVHGRSLFPWLGPFAHTPGLVLSVLLFYRLTPTADATQTAKEESS